MSDTLDRAEGRFMQMIATGSSLQAVLEAIVAQVELLVPGTFASVLLVDKSGHCLRHGAAPSLPVAYQRAVDGVAIGPSSGSCGTAAFRAAEVISEDIATDPLWDNFRSLALKYDLRSAWSTPICGGAGEVLGTLAFYRSTCWRPGRYEHHVVAMATHAAAIAIRRDREEQRLRKLSAAVEQSADSVLIMNLEGYVEYVNESFLRVSGFERDEVLGSRPAILQESRASSPVGREIWDALRRGEPWRGELVNRRKDGRAYFEDCRISPLREPGGLITHYLTVGSDVTEYK
ncbi:MAG: PAS domain-containing protein, partial [Steroidobacteraceae bacterium]